LHPQGSFVLCIIPLRLQRFCLAALQGGSARISRKLNNHLLLQLAVNRIQDKGCA
jgi:hypothetical protein